MSVLSNSISYNIIIKPGIVEGQPSEQIVLNNFKKVVKENLKVDFVENINKETGQSVFSKKGVIFFYISPLSNSIYNYLSVNIFDTNFIQPIENFIQNTPQFYTGDDLIALYFDSEDQRRTYLNLLSISSHQGGKLNTTLLEFFTKILSSDDKDVREQAVASFKDSAYRNIGINLLLQRLEVEKESEVVSAIKNELAYLIVDYLLELNFNPGNTADINLLCNNAFSRTSEDGEEYNILDEIDFTGCDLHDLVYAVFCEGLFSEDENLREGAIYIIYDYCNEFCPRWEFIAEVLMDARKKENNKDLIRIINSRLYLIVHEGRKLSEETRKDIEQTLKQYPDLEEPKEDFWP